MNSQGVGKGKFGEWLLKNMLDTGFDYLTLARKIDTHNSIIDCHVRHITCPTFEIVVAYCWAFGMKDDPEDIYKLVKEDWDL